VSSTRIVAPTRRNAPLVVKVDVTDAVALNEPLYQCAWVFTPDPVALTSHARPPVVLCHPGGTYDKRYWHLEVPGHPGYSLAEHLAAAGCVVVAIDHVGVGESTRPRNGGGVNLRTLARGDAHVAHWVGEAVATGSLSPDLAPLPRARLIGLGHSMGSAITLMVQAESHIFDAVASLGYTVFGNGDPDASGGEAQSAPISDTVDMLLTGSSNFYLSPPREELHSLFYLPDVPAEVVAADDDAATVVPRRCVDDGTRLSLIQPLAREIDVPLFIGLAEHDLSAFPRQEPAGFPACDDITLVVLRGSAHCHNFAATRHHLWNRLAGWVASLDE
jgi:pimeloyl-ACP methyl ester carboxylesterase